MQSSIIRRAGLLAVTVLALAAAAPAASQAQPIDSTPAPKKDCQPPEGGGVIKHGETGTRGSITYKCNDGVGCQVENGQTTGKCSHMARATRRPPRWRPGKFTTRVVRGGTLSVAKR